MRVESGAFLLFLFALWIVGLLFPKRVAGWGFALWFPMSALATIVSLIGLFAIPAVSRKTEGMGEGFAKFGAIVVISYAIPAWVIFILSVVRRPRQTIDYRLRSVLLGIGALAAFAMIFLSRSGHWGVRRIWTTKPGNKRQ